MYSLRSHPSHLSDDPALITRGAKQTWLAFQSEIERLGEEYSGLRGKRVGLVLAPTFESIARMFGLASVNAHVFLIGSSTSDDLLRTWCEELALCSVLLPGDSMLESSGSVIGATQGAITILTSGTTGKPKAVEHTWESLSRPVRFSNTAFGDRWLLTYQPHLYAGLQVILQCLLNFGALVLPPPSASADEIAELAVKADVHFASATPSYWRWLMTMAGPDRLRHIPLRQITLGGEAADQATLDALKQCFPRTRLVHIYATTELGRCFSVSDGREGFPAMFLGKESPDGVEMRIDDGELVVRSANCMSRYDRKSSSPGRTDWFHTGDLVQVIDERVIFVGRKTDMINVGGNKVAPVQVENVIRAVPGVADAHVYGEPSSIVGEIVKCDLVIQTGFDSQEVERAVRAKTSSNLAGFQRPRLITIVDAIPRTDAGKMRRRSASPDP